MEHIFASDFVFQWDRTVQGPNGIRFHYYRLASGTLTWTGVASRTAAGCVVTVAPNTLMREFQPDVADFGQLLIIESPGASGYLGQGQSIRRDAPSARKTTTCAVGSPTVEEGFPAAVWLVTDGEARGASPPTPRDGFDVSAFPKVESLGGTRLINGERTTAEAVFEWHLKSGPCASLWAQYERLIRVHNEIFNTSFELSRESQARLDSAAKKAAEPLTLPGLAKDLGEQIGFYAAERVLEAQSRKAQIWILDLSRIVRETGKFVLRGAERVLAIKTLADFASAGAEFVVALEVYERETLMLKESYGRANEMLILAIAARDKAIRCDDQTAAAAPPAGPSLDARARAYLDSLPLGSWGEYRIGNQNYLGGAAALEAAKREILRQDRSKQAKPRGGSRLAERGAVLASLAALGVLAADSVTTVAQLDSAARLLGRAAQLFEAGAAKVDVAMRRRQAAEDSLVAIHKSLAPDGRK
jgi:hypothetical protein